jgi:hypothetical protein
VELYLNIADLFLDLAELTSDSRYIPRTGVAILYSRYILEASGAIFNIAEIFLELAELFFKIADLLLELGELFLNTYSRFILGFAGAVPSDSTVDLSLELAELFFKIAEIFLELAELSLPIAFWVLVPLSLLRRQFMA